MLLVYTTIYFLSMVLYYTGLNNIASILNILLAIFLFLAETFKKNRIISIRGLFALGFIGGFGISLLKLSNLSDTYDLMTFLVVYVSYFAIYFGAYVVDKNFKEKKYINKSVRVVKTDSLINSQDIFIFVVTIVTLISFIAEALMLGFIPAFEVDTPHAYSTFHIFGLHYITTLYVFIPSIAICNYCYGEREKKDIYILIFSYIYIVIIATLLVSRAQLIMSIILSIFVALICKKDSVWSHISDKKIKLKNIIIVLLLVVFFVAIYIVITVKRAHDVVYLNQIFDMKDKNMPIFITQPYMYIAHNFENLNYMIKNIFRHTFGRRILYPLFTLTFIKKFFPIVVDSPYYIIKEELSTVTLVYDFYYDFGFAGVVIFCFIIGYLGKILENKVYGMIEEKCIVKNNYIVILLALISYYMLFSFFQTYFSLTDTWVHIIFLMIVSSLFVMTRRNIKSKDMGGKYEDNQNKELRRDEQGGSADILFGA